MVKVECRVVYGLALNFRHRPVGSAHREMLPLPHIGLGLLDFFPAINWRENDLAAIEKTLICNFDGA